MSGYLRIDEEIRKELGDGEEVLWSAQPDARKLFSPVDAFYIPFSLIWAAGVAVGLVINLTIEFVLPVFVALSCFCLLGVYVLFGRFIVRHFRKLKKIYLLTNKRVVEISAGRKRRVKSVYYSKINGMYSTSNKKGEGKIMFENKALFTDLYWNTGIDVLMPYKDGIPRFYDLKDVKQTAWDNQKEDG